MNEKNLTTRSLGLKDDIRACLKNGAISHATLCELLPAFTPRQISQSLDHLRTMGGISRTGGRKNYLYSIYRPGEKVPAMTHAFKPLKRDIFSNWRLCDRAPFDGRLTALIR